MELIGAAGMGLGGLIAFIGWIWLLVVGFKEGGVLWGLLIFFFSGLGGLIFCIVHKTGWMPFILMIVGGLVASFGMVPMVLSNMENM
jgi:hypothetical protein